MSDLAQRAQLATTLFRLTRPSDEDCLDQLDRAVNHGPMKGLIPPVPMEDLLTALRAVHEFALQASVEVLTAEDLQALVEFHLANPGLMQRHQELLATVDEAATSLVRTVIQEWLAQQEHS